MADTAPAVVLDSPSSGARSNTRRKPETPRQAGNRLRERSPGPALKCLICLDGIKADCMATTPCGHVFCYECIMDAVRATKKCPKCRKTTTLKQIKRLYPN
ncbi:hypothetical protein OEZ86_006569 [Tetradesmus obliquus]|nr:hypothetical protein OEZ86_006569 [Tetradesmus obliquus]